MTLISKFIFLAYIGRHLEVADMGVYGLLTATVGVSVTLLGWEFYAFSTREILASATSARALYIRDQLVFHTIGYAVLIPLTLPVFESGSLAWGLAGWFYLLTILEHLAQESARLFNTLFRPVLSTMLFFVRSAAWGYLVIGLGLWRPEWNTLTTVWTAWALGIAVSLVLGGLALRDLEWSLVRTSPVDWAWIRRGVLTGTPFFVSAILYRIVELADRYLIHYMRSDAEVGVYSFYGTLANVIPAVIGAGVSSILVPKIVESFQTKRAEDYLRYFRMLVLATTAGLAVTVPIVFASIVAMQGYLAKPEYASELTTCAVLLVSTSAGILAGLPGVALYARREDRALLLSVLIAAIVNTGLNFALIPPFGILGAAWATVAAYVVMGVYQWIRLMRVVPVTETNASLRAGV